METTLVKSLPALFRDSRHIFLLLAGIIFFAYANSINNDFISDDLTAIVHNPHIPSFTETIKANRIGPVPALVESFVFQLVGTHPPLFHFNNLVWHFGTTVLIYLIIYLLSKSRDLALVSGILFALHPIHTENVTWISGLSYIVCAFFILLTLLIYILIDQRLISRKFFLILAIPTVLAFLSSYQAVVLPVLLLLYAFSFTTLKKCLSITWPVFVVSFLFSLNFVATFTGRASAFAYNSRGSLIVYNPLVQVPVALMSYLKLLIVPFGLTLYHENFSLPTWMFSLCLVFSLGLLLICLFFYRKNRVLFFSVMLFLISLTPTLSPILIGWLVAERYVYLGSLGIIVIISYTLLVLKHKFASLFWLLFISLAVFYFFLTASRNAQWKNQDTLWPATVAASPYSTLAHNNMGDYYSRHGDLQAAIREFSQAVALKTDNADAIHNLGLAYLQTGEATKAAELFRLSLKYNPQLVESAIGLYTIDLQMHNSAQAQGDLDLAIKINPRSPLVYNVLALQLLNQGKKAQAIQLLRQALTIDPNFQPAQQNLEILTSQ